MEGCDFLLCRAPAHWEWKVALLVWDCGGLPLLPAFSSMWAEWVLLPLLFLLLTSGA